MDQVTRLENLKKQHGDLARQKIQQETQLASLEATQKDLEARMKEEFGCDSLDELREKLKALQAADQEAVSTFEASLQSIQEELSEIQEGA